MGRRLNAGRIMTPEVVTAQESTPVKEVVKAMDDNDISAIPILADSGDDLVGIVTEGDLVVKQGHADDREPPGWFATPRRRRTAVKVAADVAGELMTSPVVTIDPDATLIHIARTMAESSVKRLPVVDSDDHLIGMVSRTDVIKAFLRSDDEIREDIEGNVLGPGLPGEKSVAATVTDGVVHLRGVVERRSTAEMLDDVVGAIDGVVDVVSEVTYERDDLVRGSSRVAPDEANTFFPRPFYR